MVDEQEQQEETYYEAINNRKRGCRNRHRLFIQEEPTILPNQLDINLKAFEEGRRSRGRREGKRDGVLTSGVQWFQ